MSTSRSLSICVFIDALGYALLRRHAFLDDVLVLKQPLGTIFGYSSTCDPTIITGLLPRDHGHFSFYYYNPAGSPFRWLRPLRWLPTALTSRGRVRHHLSRVVKYALGYTGYFQLYAMPFGLLPYFDYSEKRDLYQPGGINSGARTIFDELRDRAVPFYLSDWRRSEQHNLASLHTALAQGRLRFAYLYLAAMDAVLHRDGTQADSVARKITWYDQQLREVLARAARHYDAIRLFVFSDHGMTDCGEDYDLMRVIDGLGLRFGTDYVAAYDSTMARFWFLTARARDRISACLAGETRGTILTAATLHDYGCDFANHMYGELLFMLHPGVLLCPSHMGVTHLAGMHGYDPYHPDSVASFSSNVALAAAPRRLDDLYDLMYHEAFGAPAPARPTPTQT